MKGSCVSSCIYRSQRRGGDRELKEGGRGEEYIRVCQVIYEDSCALGHGEDGIGLDLGVRREDALGQAGDDGLG